MQLSAPSVSSDPSLATLVAPGQPNPAAAEGNPVCFAQLFAEMTPGSAAPAGGLPAQLPVSEMPASLAQLFMNSVASGTPAGSSPVKAGPERAFASVVPAALTGTPAPAAVVPATIAEPMVPVQAGPCCGEASHADQVSSGAGLPAAGVAGKATPAGQGEGRAAVAPGQTDEFPGRGPDVEKLPPTAAAGERALGKSRPAWAESRPKSRGAVAAEAALPEIPPAIIPLPVPVATPVDFTAMQPAVQLVDTRIAGTGEEPAQDAAGEETARTVTWTPEAPTHRGEAFGLARASDLRTWTRQENSAPRAFGAAPEVPSQAPEVSAPSPAWQASPMAHMRSAGTEEDSATAAAMPGLQPVPVKEKTTASRAGETVEAKGLALRPAGGSENGAEKFAEFGGNGKTKEETESSLSNKHSLTSSKEGVEKTEASFGTRFANFGVTMSAERSNSHAAPHHVMGASLDPSGAMGSTALREPMSAAEVPATVSGAVEAALAAAERCSIEGRHTVNLRFSVGGEELSVRVDLRADEVRATFRTDSPELRTALAQEWQVVARETGDRAMRLAEPVFAPRESNASPTAGFGGDGTPHHQRDAQSQRAADEVFATMVPVRARGTAPATERGVASTGRRLGSLPTSVHLHTLA